MAQITLTSQALILLNITDSEKDKLADSFDLFSNTNGDQIFDASDIEDLSPEMKQLIDLFGQDAASQIQGYYCLIV